MDIDITKQSEKYNEEKTITVLYLMGLFIFIPLVAVFMFLRTDMAINYLIKGGHFCSSKRVTGLNCPGCGGTRASIYLARFMIADSLRLNAAVLVTVILYLYFMIRQTLHRISPLKVKSLKEKDTYIMTGILIITVIVRWVICNWVFVI